MLLPGTPPNEADLNWLAESWLTPEVVEQAGIRRVDDPTGRQLFGRNGNAGEYQGLIFPYIWPSEDWVREYRLRRDRPDLVPKGGSLREAAKYLGPPGRRNLLYVPPGTAPESLADAGLPIVFTEGEKKTLALSRLAAWEVDQPRWMSVGLAGVWGFRSTGKINGPNGERRDLKGTIPDLDRIAWDGRTVYIVFDSDALTNDLVAAARRKLAIELRQRGARVMLVNVPESDSGKAGIDDLLATEGPEAALQLIDQATETGDPDLTRQAYTDAGNAERLKLLHGRDLCYCPEFKSWLVYDGRRWQADAANRAPYLVIDTMRATYRQAASVENKQEREQLEKHSRKSEQARSVKDTLALTQCLPDMTRPVTAFDQRPLLLHTQTGTLDLETGKLYPHRRTDRLMKIVPHPFERNGECPLFLRFLYGCMGDIDGASDAQREAAHVRVEFLLRALGMSITADVSEKCVLCLFGPTNAGKTTFLNAVRYALGDDYAGQVRIDSLMANSRQSDNNTQADLVDLLGKRFVTTSEAEGGHRLSEGRLKYLTQGAYSKIKAARKHQNPIEFDVTHKLWLDANERPRISGSDKSVWERLKPIPFKHEVSASQIDKKLGLRLREEAVGILALCARYCRTWQKEGLGDITDVIEARRSWQDECDPIGDFLRDECELSIGDHDCFVLARELRTRYEHGAGKTAKPSQLARSKWLRASVRGVVSRARGMTSERGKESS